MKESSDFPCLWFRLKPKSIPDLVFPLTRSPSPVHFLQLENSVNQWVSGQIRVTKLAEWSSGADKRQEERPEGEARAHVTAAIQTGLLSSLPVLLPGESHGRRSLVGYSPRGRKESDTTERLHFHFQGPWALTLAILALLWRRLLSTNS